MPLAWHQHCRSYSKTQSVKSITSTTSRPSSGPVRAAQPCVRLQHSMWPAVSFEFDNRNASCKMWDACMSCDKEVIWMA